MAYWPPFPSFNPGVAQPGARVATTPCLRRMGLVDRKPRTPNVSPKHRPGITLDGVFELHTVHVVGATSPTRILAVGACPEFGWPAVRRAFFYDRPARCVWCNERRWTL